MNPSPPLRGRDFFLRGAHRLCLGWWVWNKNFPWNRAGSSAGRPAGGPSSPWRSPAGAGDSTGGMSWGERGLMDLGTLLPEGNVLRLRRTFPWRPAQPGMLAGHRGQGADDLCFHRPARCCSAPGLEGTGPSGDPVSPGPGAGPGGPGRGAGMLCRRQDETFCLAYPLGPPPSLSPDTGFLSGPCQAFAQAAPCDLPISSRGGAHPPQRRRNEPAPGKMGCHLPQTGVKWGNAKDNGATLWIIFTCLRTNRTF